MVLFDHVFDRETERREQEREREREFCEFVEDKGRSKRRYGACIYKRIFLFLMGFRKKIFHLC